MTASHVTLTFFDTPIGLCGIAWTSAGVRRVQLPEESEAAARRRLRAETGGTEAPPDAWVAQLITRLTRHLGGVPESFASVPLDLEGVPDFHRAVYEVLRELPAGSTSTYGELAQRLGKPGAARAIGRAMARNPLPIIVPCHRVLAAGGRPGGFTAYGGWHTKRSLLALEGVELPPARGERAERKRANVSRLLERTP